MFTNRAFALVLLLVSLCCLADVASADPLPGEVLKFQQLPLNMGQGPSVGGAPYQGHDEWSTAYANYNAAQQLVDWRGTYMADDFGDKVSTPVVHIKWWGSYDQEFRGTNNQGVQQFLIAFETDVPAVNIPGTPPQPSHPGTVIQSEVVTVTTNPLTSGSGQFQEKLINVNPFENLYQYNAELALPFQELANNVYWLKIVALVDPLTQGNINWGWHDRDWSLQDTYASTTGLSTPGESIIGGVQNTTGTLDPVWHYQDDAVTGPIQITPVVPGGYSINQFQTWNPQNYIDGIDGPTPPFNIGQYSKDLAFELYTTPEPSTLVLFAVGTTAVAAVRRRRRRKSS